MLFSVTSAALRRDGGWQPSDFLGPDEWSYTLTSAELAEIDAALDHVEAVGLTMGEVDRESFPLPTLRPLLADFALEIDQGRGFVLLRGLPVEAYGVDRSSLAFWGLGAHLGRPFPQNPEGDLLGHVTDTGEATIDPTVRKYRTNHDISFHVDGADMVGLLCLRPAARGGLSRIASSLAVRQEILWRHPAFDPLFDEPMLLDLRDEQAPGELPFLALPMDYLGRGRRRVFFHYDYFTSSQRHADAPRYSRQQIELIELFERLASSPEFRIDMDLQPGDMQFIDNGTIVHARTAYEDDPAAPRHLLRLWLAAA